jgi:DNA-directed RNA polymerase subunit RPC12/RpoP
LTPADASCTLTPMTTSDYKKCCDCDAEFKRSKADATVRCPACRKRRRRAPEISAYEAKAIDAKSRAYAARRAEDKEAEAKATADYVFYRDMADRP